MYFNQNYCKKSKFWSNWKVIPMGICSTSTFHVSMRAWKPNNFFEVLFSGVGRTLFLLLFFSFFFCRSMPHGKVFRYKKVRFSRKEGTKSSTYNRKITQKKEKFLEKNLCWHVYKKCGLRSKNLNCFFQKYFLQPFEKNCFFQNL